MEANQGWDHGGGGKKAWTQPVTALCLVMITGMTGEDLSVCKGHLIVLTEHDWWRIPASDQLLRS